MGGCLRYLGYFINGRLRRDCWVVLCCGYVYDNSTSGGLRVRESLHVTDDIKMGGRVLTCAYSQFCVGVLNRGHGKIVVMILHVIFTTDPLF